MPLLCTISLVANDSPDSNAGKHLKRETSTVLDRYGKKSKASLVFGGSIHQGTNAGSLNELLDVGYGIRAQEGFLRSQNTKGRCQPSNLSLLRTIARCLHRNHPVIFNPETNGD